MQLLSSALCVVAASAAIVGVSGGSVVDPNPPVISVDPTSHHFIDDSGRVRLFHGVNAVYKAAPWLPPTDSFDAFNSLAQEDVANLQNWGFNAIRLGVMWPGVEPEAGQYNMTYLKQVDTLVTALGEAGVATIADFHQDLLHPQYCGEGIPTHALDATDHTCHDSIISWVASLFGACKTFEQYNLTVDPATGYPEVSACLQTPFSLYYPTPELSSAFMNLYTNATLTAKLVNYWRVMAQQLGKNPYVLGYDLFNEPWPGNIWSDPLLLEAGAADKQYLQPLYEQINAAIRSSDNTKIVFYEPVQFPDTLPLFGGIVSPVGFTTTPGGHEYDDRQSMSYHVYSCTVGANVCDKNGDPLPQYDAECDKLVSTKVKQRLEDVAKLGGGAFLTEFGACSGADQCIKELRRVTEQSDAQLGSWAYWQFKFFHDVTTQSGVVEGFYNTNGTLQTEKIAALSRTYAQAVAGMPTGMVFNLDTKFFQLNYTVSLTATAPTVIFFNADIHYSNGIVVTTEPAAPLLSTSIENANWLVVKHGEGLTEGQAVTITITTKQLQQQQQQQQQGDDFVRVGGDYATVATQ